jgi:hypothetical protein
MDHPSPKLASLFAMNVVLPPVRFPHIRHLCLRDEMEPRRPFVQLSIAQTQTSEETEVHAGHN